MAANHLRGFEGGHGGGVFSSSDDDIEEEEARYLEDNENSLLLQKEGGALGVDKGKSKRGFITNYLTSVRTDEII